MKVTVISQLHIELEQSEAEWLHDRLQLSMDRAAMLGEWSDSVDKGSRWPFITSPLGDMDEINLLITDDIANTEMILDNHWKTK
jgi:hypothetical protein